jgi:hypothetical protein
MQLRWLVRLLSLAAVSVLATAAGPVRKLPQPLPDHPGHVFLAGEEVAVALPPGEPAPWRLFDYEDQPVSVGGITQGRAYLGKLPLGWYELRQGEDPTSNTVRVSLAVLAPLKVPTPASSPIGLDVAMAWFYGAERMPAAANLSALAGVNWVRDRLSWPEMEPRRGQFAAATRYDASAQAQAAAGLRQLQVNHISPAWANPRSARLPTNLVDAYHFHREIARRWRRSLEAIEPWNEADIEMFGGHTGSEIASFQKAAYLGLKAGHPNVIACQTVFADHRPDILEDFRDNEPWAYFDTFNLHHYAPFDSYPNVYADFRAVSGGKPLWVTECSVPVRWSGDERLKEPSAADLRAQAERVARVFACALHEGPSAVFYFLLPHYTEGQTQFGILRADLTPRPAYVALAAVGRLLADAKPLGRLKDAPPNVRGFLFRARPDGQASEVLVAWATEGTATLTLPRRPLGAFDHLGRPRAGPGRPVALATAPVFFVFAPGAARDFSLTPPPAPAARLKAKRCPVVLQAVLPKERVRLAASAYSLRSNQPDQIPLRVYNFGDRPVRGRLAFHAPAAWAVQLPAQVQVEPGAAADLALAVRAEGQTAGRAVEKLLIVGDFGRQGRPLLSLRFKVELSK